MTVDFDALLRCNRGTAADISAGCIICCTGFISGVLAVTSLLLVRLLVQHIVRPSRSNTRRSRRKSVVSRVLLGDRGLCVRDILSLILRREALALLGLARRGI